MSMTSLFEKENSCLVWRNPVPGLFSLSQLFLFLLIIFRCFSRIHLAKTCEASTFWLGFLCSSVSCILPLPRLGTNLIVQKIVTLHPWSVLLRLENRNLFKIASKWEPLIQSLTKFALLIITSSHFTMLCNKRLNVPSLFKV